MSMIDKAISARFAGGIDHQKGLLHPRGAISGSRKNGKSRTR